MLKNRLILLVLAVAIVGAACSSDDGATTTTTRPDTSTTTIPGTSTTEPEPVTSTTVPLTGVPTEYADYLQQASACGADQPEPVTPMEFDAPGDADVHGAVSITLETSCGSIHIDLDASVAPETVNSFVFLAEEGYFDGSVSHRIIPGFMMQAGDPTATGRGGPGYVIPDELPDDGSVYQRGVVAMANAGPGTGGSQFFILFGPADWLPPSYSVFGIVVSGFETLDALEEIPLGQNPLGGDQTPSTPLESLYIESVSVDR